MSLYLRVEQALYDGSSRMDSVLICIGKVLRPHTASTQWVVECRDLEVVSDRTLLRERAHRADGVSLEPRQQGKERSDFTRSTDSHSSGGWHAPVHCCDY